MTDLKTTLEVANAQLQYLLSGKLIKAKKELYEMPFEEFVKNISVYTYYDSYHRYKCHFVGDKKNDWFMGAKKDYQEYSLLQLQKQDIYKKSKMKDVLKNASIYWCDADRSWQSCWHRQYAQKMAYKTVIEQAIKKGLNVPDSVMKEYNL